MCIININIFYIKLVKVISRRARTTVILGPREYIFPNPLIYLWLLHISGARVPGWGYLFQSLTAKKMQSLKPIEKKKRSGILVPFVSKDPEVWSQPVVARAEAKVSSTKSQLCRGKVS